MAVGAGCFGSGLAVTAAGIATHNLPLLYAGNVLAGLGYGCAYTPPVQAIINWFPDKKGNERNNCLRLIIGDKFGSNIKVSRYI